MLYKWTMTSLCVHEKAVTYLPQHNTDTKHLYVSSGFGQSCFSHLTLSVQTQTTTNTDAKHLCLIQFGRILLFTPYHSYYCPLQKHAYTKDLCVSPTLEESSFSHLTTATIAPYKNMLTPKTCVSQPVWKNPVFHTLPQSLLPPTTCSHQRPVSHPVLESPVSQTCLATEHPRRDCCRCCQCFQGTWLWHWFLK